MTPNKSDSGELRKILVKFGKRPFQFPGVDGPVRLVATDAEIDEALREITAHIQAVGEEIIGEDESLNNPSGTSMVLRLHDILRLARNDERMNQRQRLAQYLGGKQQ